MNPAGSSSFSRHLAVVTGAGRGIGKAIALEFAKRGLDVALIGLSEQHLREVALEITQQHNHTHVTVAPCDLANAENITRVAREILDKHSAPRVLVNNAGVVLRSRVEETHEAGWDHLFNVNLKAPFWLTRAFLPAMRAAQVGRIVHVASISATLGTAQLAAYCASKWGLVGFVKSLAEELRGSGVQTLGISPGSVDTDMLQGSGFAPKMTADEVARVVAFLALDAPNAMQGSVVEMFGD